METEIQQIIKLALAFLIAYGVSAGMSKLMVGGARIVKFQGKKKYR